MQNGIATETVWQFLINWYIHLLCDSVILLLNVYPEQIKTFIHSENLFFIRYMGKQTMIHWHNGILLINKNEQRININNNLDKFQRHYSGWKKAILKGCRVYDSICKTFMKIPSYGNGEQSRIVQSLGMGKVWPHRGITKEFWGFIELFITLVVVVVTWIKMC